MQNETTMKTLSLTQINSQIKKEVIKLMGKFQTSYIKSITRNDDLYLESNILISYKSTCQIGLIVNYKLKAIFNKYTNEIKLIEF